VNRTVVVRKYTGEKNVKMTCDFLFVLATLERRISCLKMRLFHSCCSSSQPASGGHYRNIVDIYHARESETYEHALKILIRTVN
jgi:hypothetical protein